MRLNISYQEIENIYRKQNLKGLQVIILLVISNRIHFYCVIQQYD